MDENTERGLLVELVTNRLVAQKINKCKYIIFHFAINLCRVKDPIEVYALKIDSSDLCLLLLGTNVFIEGLISKVKCIFHRFLLLFIATSRIPPFLALCCSFGFSSVEPLKSVILELLCSKISQFLRDFLNELVLRNQHRVRCKDYLMKLVGPWNAEIYF